MIPFVGLSQSGPRICSLRGLAAATITVIFVAWLCEHAGVEVNSCDHASAYVA